jgi:Carbohydrate esterase, sialic acid-specific acetylesterase
MHARVSTGRIRRALLVAAVILLIIALGRYAGLGQPSERTKLSLKLDKIVRVDTEPVVSCATIAAQHPIVILALGQSNAANHGARAADTDVPIALIADGKCIMAVDPLPGGTGVGGSIWYRLPRHLSQLIQPRHRPVVISVLGVDATAIDEWTNEASPIRAQLIRQLQSMRSVELAPQLVLWQQGESDAKNGTTESAYADELDKLAGILDQAGVNAPIVAALSTVCRSDPNDAIRHAIETKAASNPRFKLGPDTDYDIHAGLRSNKCHFSTEGLDRAAQLWAATIAPLVASP